MVSPQRARVIPNLTEDLDSWVETRELIKVERLQKVELYHGYLFLVGEEIRAETTAAEDGDNPSSLAQSVIRIDS